MDGVQLPQGYRATTRRHFLPLSYHRSLVSQKICCQLFFDSHILITNSDVMFCVMQYHLYNLKKNVKNTHEGVLLLVKIKAFSTPTWVFFTFLKFYKWYQIMQNITI